jgi:hypothetical protein
MFSTFIDAPQWRAPVHEEDFDMKLRDSKQLGLIWYLMPAVWVVAGIAGLLAVSQWPGLVADQVQAQTAAATLAFPLLPEANTELSVPAAGSVFTDRRWEVSEVVAQF